MNAELMLRIPSNSIQFRKKFHSAKKHPNESMTDWYHRLKQLSELCNYGSHLEAFVLDQFYMGLDDKILERLCALQDDLSLTNIELDRQVTPDSGDNDTFIDVKPDIATIKQEELTSDCEPYDEHYSNDFQNHNDDDDIHDNHGIQPEVSLTELNESDTLPSRQTHKHPNSFECYLCHLTFRTVGHLTFHFIRFHRGYHTIGVTKQCHLCGKWIKDSSNMIRHLNMHFNVKPYVCHICDSSFARFISLTNHLQRHNKANVQVFNCSKCDKTFISNRDLIKHNRTHDKPIITISQKLDEVVKKHKSLKAKTKAPPKAATELSCEICCKSFESQNVFDDHMKVHCETEWLCHLCGKKLSNKRNLIYHYRIHEGSKNFSCELCDKAFSCKEKLKLHAKVHSGIRAHVCLVCNKTYIQKSHLISHSKVHMVVDKEFKCGQCPKQFSEKIKFQVHLRKHAGLRPYCCTWTGCEKTFKSPSHRLEHERIHSGEKAYECRICRKRFTQRSTLSGHIKWHEKPKTEKVRRKRLKNNLSSGLGLDIVDL